MAVWSADFRASLLVYFVFASFFCISSCLERQLVAKVNPGCPAERCNASVVEVVHVRADGSNDTLHHVWCFHGKPTVLIALTSHAANLFVAWEYFPDLSSSIFFSPPPQYSFGVLVNQIFEFDDVEDVGSMNTTNHNASYIRKVDLPDSWEMKHFQQNLDSVLLVMDGSWKKNISSVKNGIFRFELETFRKKSHGPNLPHLLVSPNATQMELSLRDMLTNSSFQQSRFAIELVMAANETTESSVVSSSFKSIDDEHTPGVFTLVDLQTTASKRSSNGGYLQWRPVAYVSDERDIVNSTESFLYNVTKVANSPSECEGTLFAAYFGSNLSTSLLNAVNISFGASDDGFYSKYNASIWTTTVGYGHPPDENFSLMVILIMSICLGLPTVLIVLSGFYIALRRISYRKDDLFLSE